MIPCIMNTNINWLFQVVSLCCVFMPRPRIWSPKVIAVEDALVGVQFREEFCPEFATHDRMRDDFREFKRLNPTLEEGDVYVALVGQMRRAGLSEGTVSVYIQMLDHLSINLAHALAETSHAPDLTDAQLKELVERADTGLQPGMYLMMCTGAHAADIARLMRHQVEYDVKSNRLEVTWFVTKSRRSRKDRTTGRDFPPLDFVPASFVTSLKGKEDEKAWPITATDINDFLSGASTSLVFRRAFVRRCAALEYPIEAVAELLTHKDTTMIKAHYSQFSLSAKLDIAKKRNREEHSSGQIPDSSLLFKKTSSELQGLQGMATTAVAATKRTPAKRKQRSE